jgi:hypothetical protein
MAVGLFVGTRHSMVIDMPIFALGWVLVTLIFPQTELSLDGLRIGIERFVRNIGDAFDSEMCVIGLAAVVALQLFFRKSNKLVFILLRYAAMLVLIFGIYPVIQKAVRQPRAMRVLLAVMIAGAAANVAFVSLYPFPADVDLNNLTHGMGNAYKMLGCMLGVWATYECDLRWTKFDTKAPLLGQALKLVLGFALLLAIKSGGKAPLQALFANDYLADGLRYLLMVIFAGCIWPLTFRFFATLGKKK